MVKSLLKICSHRNFWNCFYIWSIYTVKPSGEVTTKIPAFTVMYKFPFYPRCFRPFLKRSLHKSTLSQTCLVYYRKMKLRDQQEARNKKFVSNS